MVVSDNGASGEGGPNGSFNENKFFNNVPDSIEANLERLDELGSPSSYNHYNTGWAWAFDTPFPYWKRFAGYEGGVADPLLVSWPKGIDANGDVRDQYVHAVDVVPTLYDMLGIEPPEVLKGYTQSPIEGESFAASFSDASAPRARDPVLLDARDAGALPPGLAREHAAPADLRLGQVPPRRMGALQPRRGPLPDAQPRRRAPREARRAQGAVVVLRRASTRDCRSTTAPRSRSSRTSAAAAERAA